MRVCRRFRAGIPHCGAGTHVLLTRAPLPLSLRSEGVRLACVRHAASVYPEPGSNSPSKCISNLFTRLKCIVNELSPIDRVNMYSCVYYPYHSSVVQVLRLLPHLCSSQRRPACSAGACRVQVRYYHRPCALSSTFSARFRMYRANDVYPSPSSGGCESWLR